jgi:putative phosphoribosyl transferase
LNEDVLAALNIPPTVVDQVADEEQRELERREREYRDDRPRPDVHGKTVILVDDGLATGSTMRAAVKALAPQHPARIVVAVPTAPLDVCDEMRHEVDEVVCGTTPEPFYGVGLWYDDFSQTTDDEVRELLRASDKSKVARDA